MQKTAGFGTVKKGRGSVQRITLTNTGQLPLSGSISTSGKGFAPVGGQLFCLQPGQKANVKVRFKPRNVKATKGKLVISSTAAKSTTTVKLSGKGRR